MFYYIVAASNDGYYILKESNEIIATTDTTSTGTVIKYKYDATNPTCEKVATVGIYLKEADKYIKLTRDGKGKYFANSELACNDANVGKMTTNGLCIGNFGGDNPNEIHLPDDSLQESVEMFVPHKSTSDLFNWDRENANYYAILVNKDFIILNEKFESM